MDLSLAGIANAFAQMSGWEILAVVFGIGYVLLAAKESLWTWLFAFLSTIIHDHGCVWFCFVEEWRREGGRT
jgi:nicotinamide mononucleotide transporter